MHRVKHLFERVCSLSNLPVAAKEALRGKRTRPPGAMFFAEQEKELPALHEEVASGTYCSCENPFLPLVRESLLALLVRESLLARISYPKNSFSTSKSEKATWPIS